jgi:hypothetical protein
MATAKLTSGSAKYSTPKLPPGINTLYGLGVPDKVIQAILLHENIPTMQRSYIQTGPEDVTNAMKQLKCKKLLVQQLCRRSR